MHERTITVNGRRIATMLVAAVLASQAGLGSRADEPTLTVARDDATVSVSAGDRPLLQYRYTDVPFKPYVKAWFSPQGRNVLRDAPRDHHHHHAMMFAVAADGVDFWAENAKCGRQVHRSLGDVKTGVKDGVARASFLHRIDWVAPDSDAVLLREQRTIEVFRAEGLPASLLSWHCRLQPANAKESVTLGGRHYFGLGIRFVESMDRVGRFFNADGKEGRIVRGEERLVRTKWCAYTAPVDGKPVTVAVFDHPRNPRHPATMFTMPRGFAYLAVTLNLSNEPMTVEAGQPLELTYGAALWDGEVEAPEVEELYRRWVGWQ